METLFTEGKVRMAPSGGAEWTMSVCGDLRVNREAHPRMTRRGWPAESVRNWLESDLVIANLEAPVLQSARRRGVSSVSRAFPMLAMPPAVLDRASEMGITHLSLANNHIRDYGPDGLMETIEQARSHGLTVFGAGATRRAAARYALHRVQGTRLALGAYAQNEDIAAGTRLPGANPLDPDRVVEDVVRMRKKADLVFLFLHDGYEFSEVPRVEFLRLCRRAAAAGAAAIFGHHPHVPHGLEMVGGCPVFYSLGNFLFRMNPHTGTEWAGKSFVPKLTFSGRKLCALELTPIYLDDDFIPRPSAGAERRKTLRHLRRLSGLLEEAKVDAANRVFVKRHVWDVICDGVFDAGRRNDTTWLREFKRSQILKDPYLKAMKDGARLWRSGGDFPSF